MGLKTVGLSALLLALAPVTTSAVEPSPGAESASRGIEYLLSMSVEGTLLVDTDGSVREYALTTKVSPGLAEAIGKAVKSWRFEPVLIDGQLVRAAAKMHISLAATKTGQDYQVHVENAVFRPADPASGKVPVAQSGSVEATGRRMNPPRYPSAMLHAGIGGRVLVALHFSPEGKVLEVVPVQSMLFDTRGQDRMLSKAIEQFEDATLEAARRWRVAVSVKPGAATTAMDFTAYTTVDYVIGTHAVAEPAGEWRLVARNARRSPPWLSEVNAPNVGVADLASGETLPLSEALRLRSPVAGSAL
jgi:outer membrane biosynthesis protein TonB